jgi:hypothetical protein
MANYLPHRLPSLVPQPAEISKRIFLKIESFCPLLREMPREPFPNHANPWVSRVVEEKTNKNESNLSQNSDFIIICIGTSIIDHHRLFESSDALPIFRSRQAIGLKHSTYHTLHPPTNFFRGADRQKI